MQISFEEKDINMAIIDAESNQSRGDTAGKPAGGGQQYFNKRRKDRAGGKWNRNGEAKENSEGGTIMAVGSIVDYLKGKGQDSSYSARKKLAGQYGISDYSGTAKQNTQLLKALQGQSGSNALSQSTACAVLPAERVKRPECHGCPSVKL